MESEHQHTDELKELVRQNIAIAQENNQMLHAMRRSARLSRLGRLVWLAIIVGVSIYSYWYLQPYLDQILKMYANIQNLQQTAQTYIH